MDELGRRPGDTEPGSGGPGQPTATADTPAASGAPPSGAGDPDPVAPPPETIARLADDLLPALIARLDASGLGELEVRTDAWRIRLRKSYDRRRGPTLPEGRRRPGEHAEVGHGRRGEPRSEPAHASRADGRGHGSPPEAGHGDPPGDMQGGAAPVAVEGDGHADRVMRADALAPAIAASPAVGYFTPRDGWTTGRHVRSGDVVGYVDCLGVRQDVLAPVDGFLGRLLAQAGPAQEPAQPAERPAAESSVPGTEPPPGAGFAAAGREGA